MQLGSKLPALAAGAILVLVVPRVAEGHFDLLQPPAADNASDGGKGAPPCGPTTSSNVVTPAQGGHPISVSLKETVMHPGHYRFALAIRSRAELPPDPEVVVKNGQSVSATIEDPVVFPVLADGVFAHTSGTAPLSWQTSLVLPNVTCAKCTLQVIEFMAQHGSNPGGGYFYHHCADLQITADPSLPLAVLDGGTPDAAAGGDAAKGGGGDAPSASGGAGGARTSGSAGGATGSSGGTGHDGGGSGGTVASGGTRGSGGTVANGGTSGSGGAVASGGTSASGGTLASGGASGGTVASGGTSGSGGTVASGGTVTNGGTSGSGGSAGASSAGGASASASGPGSAGRSSGGCSLALSSADARAPGWALLALVLAWRRRRLRWPQRSAADRSRDADRQRAHESRPG